MRTFRERDFMGDDRVVVSRGKVAHIITCDTSQIWHNEAMTLCGRLAVADEDRPDPHFEVPTCKVCEHRLFAT